MRIITAALAGLALCAFANVHAAYPERPIKMIVPWAAGGDTDNIFRPFAPALQKALGGATVVIANVGGASGTVGAREAKGSPADGYTLYAVHDYIHSTYYIGITDVNYWDFEPVCLIAATPSILTASPKTKWTSMKELVEDAKAHPGQIFGRRNAGLDQPFLSGAGGESRRHQVQIYFLRWPGPAHERDSRRPYRPDRRQSYAKGQGRRRSAQVPRHCNRETQPGTAQCADAEGTGLQRRLFRVARPPRPQGHARRHPVEARGRLRPGGERSGLRRFDEKTRAPTCATSTARATPSS